MILKWSRHSIFSNIIISFESVFFYSNELNCFNVTPFFLTFLQILRNILRSHSYMQTASTLAWFLNWRKSVQKKTYQWLWPHTGFAHSVLLMVDSLLHRLSFWRVFSQVWSFFYDEREENSILLCRACESNKIDRKFQLNHNNIGTKLGYFNWQLSWTYHI